jgi:hypothetical protein
MNMNGIASLQSSPMPGQMPMAGMMPGQAPMPGQIPGMMPKPGAATPAAEINQYQGMQLPQLIALFQQRPSGPLLGLITKQTQELQLQKAQANQAAMAQAAGQGGATVKDMAIGNALQAIQPSNAGGEMQGYSGGGAVAFEDGGETEDLSDDPSLPLRERMARAQKRMALSRQQGIGRSFAERFPAPVESTTDTGDELSRMLARAPAPVPVMSPEAQALMSRQGPRGIMASPRAAVRPQQSQPQRQQAAQASTGIAIPQTGMTPEERQFYEAQRAALEGRKARPESLTRAEQGLADLARAQIEAQQRESEEFRREAMERRDAALARSQRNFWENPQALLALAGGIDTRRGQGAGSLARGLASIMGQQEGMAEAARKEYAQAQQMQRTLDAAVRNTQMLEAQRQVALANNEYGRVNELDDKILQSRGAEAAAKRAIADKEFSQAMKAKEVGIQESGLKLREREAARGPVPSFQDQLTKSAVESYLKQNPGKTMADAFEWLRGAGKPDRAALTYAQASDDVQKLLDSPNGFMEINAIRQSAKKAGKPEPTLPEIKEMLIQRMLQDSRSRFAGQGSPTSAPQVPMYASNPKTGERIMSTDGGQTWKPA